MHELVLANVWEVPAVVTVPLSREYCTQEWYARVGGTMYEAGNTGGNARSPARHFPQPQ